MIFATCRGGWPESLKKKTSKQQLFIAKSYLNIICEIDTTNIDGVKRNPDKIKSLLKSYARNISTLVSNKKIINDIKERTGKMSETTYYGYINVLKQLFVIDEVGAWSPNIRSSKSIKKTPKKEFIDPSLTVVALDLSPEQLLYDLNTFGFIFENLCIRDLNICSSKSGGKILYYHDSNDLEVDCVLTLDNGDYALIEFKLGSVEEEKGAKNLLKLNNLIQKQRNEGKTHIPEPRFLAIITGGKMAYTRDDGVKIIPIGCLKR